MDPKKILIVLPHLSCGGTERTAAELANFIAGNGGNAILLLMYKKTRFYSLHPDVNVLEPGFSKQRFGKYLYIPLLLLYMRIQIRKQRPNVIFALGYITFTLFASFGLKTKVLISPRSSPKRIRFPDNIILNHLYVGSRKLVRKRIDGIIAQTNYAKSIYNERYTCPIVTIPNFLRNLKEYKLDRFNQIINIGHCSFEKGQHYLLEAFSKLDAGEWKLVIVGDGPKKKELEVLAYQLNIYERVVFTGYKEDVDLYLSQSKIFALTSIIEGYPNVLIEAMATPLPSVSFDCVAGPSDIIVNGENGFLVDVGDIETFANRLQELIDQPELRERMELKALNIKHDNDLSKIAPKYLEFFDEIAMTPKNLNPMSLDGNIQSAV